MGRPPRPAPDPEGALTCHALNRGNNRRDVFVDDTDRLAYLDVLAKAKLRYSFRFFAYCLMTNHVHSVLCPGPGQSIGRIMQSVTVAHARRHHRRHRSSGHVRQGRFKSPAVEEGSCFPAALAYVEANPLRAGMVADAAEYPRSSHPGRVGATDDPPAGRFPRVDRPGGRRAGASGGPAVACGPAAGPVGTGGVAVRHGQRPSARLARVATQPSEKVREDQKNEIIFYICINL